MDTRIYVILFLELVKYVTAGDVLVIPEICSSKVSSSDSQSKGRRRAAVLKGLVLHQLCESR